MATQREKLEAELELRKEQLEGEYAELKSKFYAKPIFAAQLGMLVGVLGTLLVQMFF